MVAVRLERGPGQGYTGTPLSYQMYYVCDNSLPREDSMTC